ncbi:stalk domain-containing protein [Cohnella phaseoli]|uniref:NHL repeat-containing protein n=1 Tax=Cohnella phaseoli TaxID=456490 RepID=A0A3D9KN72_9BACL|nr:stalk domain-containing protein [Cohnella phaseoli]RED87618.1 NHL repeat-containing protein [Cohnella phaseoli]
MKNNKMKLAAVVTAIGILGGTFATAAAAAPSWTQSTKLYEVRSWAGQAGVGHRDGALSDTTFYHPKSAVELANGRLLIADSLNHRLRTLDADKSALYAGSWLGEDAAGNPLSGLNNDSAEQAAFHSPAGLAVDAKGNVYVADSGNHAIRKITPDGTVSTLAGNGLLGSSDGKGAEAKFHSPADVAIDSKGNVYVADTLNHLIRKIAPNGTVSTLNATSARLIEYVPGAVENAGDFLDGPLASAKFNEPSGLAVDAKDNLYVSDRGNQRIRYIDLTSGQVSTVAGGGSYDGANAYFVQGDYADGEAAKSRFNAPEGLAVTADGALVIADSLNHVVRMLKDGQVTTIAGVPTEPGSVNGVTASSQFNHPTDVVALADGRLAIVDEFGNKIRIVQKYAAPAKLPVGGDIAVLLNGTLVSTEVAAQLKAGAVLLPVRDVGKALGYQVGYDKKTGEALLSKDGTVYAISEGKDAVKKTVAGASNTVKLNAKTISIDGRMFIPVRFFADESGLDIQWDGAAKIVVIRNKEF